MVQFLAQHCTYSRLCLSLESDYAVVWYSQLQKLKEIPTHYE